MLRLKSAKQYIYILAMILSLTLLLGVNLSGCGTHGRPGSFDPPSAEPTEEPTDEPTAEPTEQPTAEPTDEPTGDPTEEPTGEPTAEPTEAPTEGPTAEPTELPSEEPSQDPESVETALTGFEYDETEDRLYFNEDSVLAKLGYTGTVEESGGLRKARLYKRAAVSSETAAEGNRQEVTSIVIPESFEYGGTVYKITSVGDYAFYCCASLTSVTLPEGVAAIGEGAFGMCTSLTSADIPQSAVSIGDSAFAVCESLTAAAIPEGVVSIGESAFIACASLTSVRLPDSLKSLGKSAFYNCLSLSSVTLSKNLTAIGAYAFTYCKALTGINIPDGVASIGYSAFYGAGLVSVSLPASVSAIEDNAFACCEGLKEAAVSSGEVGKNAFQSCSSLESVELLEGVTSVGGGAFSDCASLSSIAVPDSVVRLGNGAFTNYIASLAWRSRVYSSDEKDDFNNAARAAGIADGEVWSGP